MAEAAPATGSAAGIDGRYQLAIAGQSNLGWLIEEAFGERLWSIQHDVCDALSAYRAEVNVPSCNSSGKTFLAGRIAWAFLLAFQPGVPCRWCYEQTGRWECGGSRVVLTSSTSDHLEDTLWMEVKRARTALRARGHEYLPEVYPRAMQTYENADHPQWTMVGVNPDTAEGIQGRHAPHKLIVAEEATALKEETANGINSLMASGDARMLCIYNPTDDNVWVELRKQDPKVVEIRIRAWDTPMFTGEPVPPGATLTTPDWISDMRARGMGPGTPEWERRVEARPWTVGTRQLIAGAWYDAARRRGLRPVGTKALGVDLARYGDAECVIARRHGPVFTALSGYPAMDQRFFWRGPLVDECLDFRPQVVVYDADGLGAGVGESVAQLESTLRSHGLVVEIIGFRGGMGAGGKFANTRSQWWWQLRVNLQNGHRSIDFDDPTLRQQITNIQYGISDRGAIKVESKENMRKRNLPSPDRADALMYADAYEGAEFVRPPSVTDDMPGVSDRSDEAYWERESKRLDEEDSLSRAQRRARRLVDPVSGLPVDVAYGYDDFYD